MKWYAPDPGDQTVRNHRWDFSRDHLVFTILAPAGNNVVTLVQFVEQSGNVRRIVLQVSVHWDQNFPTCSIDACCHCRCLTIVSSECYNANSRIHFSDL